jgi:ABC-type branched-subunit amino acid transport system substrate-binding protein
MRAQAYAPVSVPPLALSGRALGLIALGLAAAAVMAGSGCPRGNTERLATLPAVTTDDPVAEAELREARQAADAGRNEEAEALYRRFLERHGQDPLAPVAKLGLGQLLLAAGDAEEARALFAEVKHHSDEALAERARFYEGVALHLSGKHEQSRDILSRFVGRTVDPEDTALLLRTLAAASLSSDDRVGAVEALDTLARSTAPETARQEARQRLAEIIDSRATADEVATLYDRLPREGTAWTLAARRTAQEAFDAGELERVKEVTAALESAGVDLGDELEALAVKAERTGKAEPRTIGAILPLSGRGQEVGQRALQGMMVAANTPARGPPSAVSPQLVFRDDAGDAERAARAVTDLASLHRVIAIVGPVGAEASRRAAERAQELGVPLIALSPAPGLPSVGPYVFRQFVTPELEVRELVTAARAEGRKRFAIARPRTPFGTAMASAFAAAAERQGAEVVTTVDYEDGETSFGPTVRALSRHRFDALFIADRADAVALLVPALAAGRLSVRPPPGAPSKRPKRSRAFTLLLPGVGYSPELVHSTGRYLQGALVARPLPTDAAGGMAREFRQEFNARHGEEPGLFAAYAYDAVQLVRRAVESGAQTRQELADALPTMHDIETAGPSRGFAPSREPARGPRVLRLVGDSLEARTSGTEPGPTSEHRPAPQVKRAYATAMAPPMVMTPSTVSHRPKPPAMPDRRAGGRELEGTAPTAPR